MSITALPQQHNGITVSSSTNSLQTLLFVYLPPPPALHQNKSPQKPGSGCRCLSPALSTTSRVAVRTVSVAFAPPHLLEEAVEEEGAVIEEEVVVVEEEVVVDKGAMATTCLKERPGRGPGPVRLHRAMPT